jgi:hypothetical protein
MKTRMLIFVIASAIITLSFSLGSSFKSNQQEKVAENKTANTSEPIGGLVADDRP